VKNNVSIFKELKRRNVFRVVAAYVVTSWLLLQIADVASNAFDLPDWTFRFLLLILAIGLIPAAIFSWVFELTPDGIRKESEIEAGQSIAHSSGRRLNYITIGMVVIGIAFVLWQQQMEPAPRVAPAASVSTGPENPGPVSAESTAMQVNSRSIAVLPFVNMSSDPENEYFADGLSEELLNQLAQIPDLQVAGRTSSFSFKGKNEDLRTIGATLGVANVLEGSVRRQGNEVRVTAQLIRVNDGFHLWSNTYDRNMDDVFAIQDDISGNVANAMKIVLDESARQRMQAVGVRNVEAFVEYQKGREWVEAAHEGSDLLGGLSKAAVHFDRAIELVPDFAAAWWSKNDYYAHIITDGVASNEVKAQALVDLRAVQDAAWEYSGDSQRRAFIDVDRVLFSDDWTLLRDRVERALAASGCPEPSWAEIAIAIGYAEAAEAMWQRFKQCEPLSAIAPIELTMARLWQGDPEAALEVNRAGQLSIGSSPWQAATRQRALMALGRADEALAIAPELDGNVAFYGMGSEALPLALAGDRDGAVRAMEQWRQKYGPRLRGELEIHAALGDRDRANELAAELDDLPGGSMLLMITVAYCLCGAPFDLEATPNYKARVQEAELDWPPPKFIDYPLKTW